MSKYLNVRIVGILLLSQVLGGCGKQDKATPAGPTHSVPAKSAQSVSSESERNVPTIHVRRKKPGATAKLLTPSVTGRTELIYETDEIENFTSQPVEFTFWGQHDLFEYTQYINEQFLVDGNLPVPSGHLWENLVQMSSAGALLTTAHDSKSVMFTEEGWKILELPPHETVRLDWFAESDQNPEENCIWVTGFTGEQPRWNRKAGSFLAGSIARILKANLLDGSPVKIALEGESDTVVSSGGRVLRAIGQKRQDAESVACRGFVQFAP